MTRCRGRCWSGAIMGGLLAACGMGRPILPPSLVEQQPSVVAMTPAPGSLVASLAGGVSIRFSRAVDPLSVQPDTVALVRGVGDDLGLEEIVEGWRAHHYPQVRAVTTLAPSGDNVQFLPEDPLVADDGYAAIVTTAVRSREGVPFSQTAGSGSTPFIGIFALRTGAEQTAVPITAGVEDASSAGGPSVETSSSSGPVATVPQHIIPEELMINEVYYDAPGPDTNGLLFIELRGTPGGLLGNYRIHLVNGEGGVVLESITLPDNAIIPSDGLLVIADGMTGNLLTTQVAGADLVDNFDPQNGPEAVQLVDVTGGVVDIVGYGEPLALYGENGLPMYEGAPGPDAPAGQSVSRLAGATDTNNNSADFVINVTPSPGSDAVTE